MLHPSADESKTLLHPVQPGPRRWRRTRPPSRCRGRGSPPSRRRWPWCPSRGTGRGRAAGWRDEAHQVAHEVEGLDGGMDVGAGLRYLAVWAHLNVALHPAPSMSRHRIGARELGQSSQHRLPLGPRTLGDEEEAGIGATRGSSTGHSESCVAHQSILPIPPRDRHTSSAASIHTRYTYNLRLVQGSARCLCCQGASITRFRGIWKKRE